MSDELRVVHFGPTTGQIGGIESLITTLAEGRVGVHSAVAVGTTRRDDDAFTAARRFARAVRIAARLDNSQIAHVHLSHRGSFVREGLIVLVLAARRTPIVLSIHGSRFVAFADSQRMLVRSVLRRGDVIICLSPEAEQRVRDLDETAEVRLIANPVLGPADQTEPVAPLVLFAGELSFRKGVDVLLAAWESVHRQWPDWNLLLAGPAGDVDLDALPKNVSLLGKQSRAEVDALLERCSIVVLPSRHEAMPMILTEAMAHGRPFVSTNIEGIVSLSRGVQPLVSPGDPGAFGTALSDLIGNPERRLKLGEDAYAHYLETRSPIAVAPLLREAYLTAMAAASRRSAPVPAPGVDETI
jgi:glycosyltransferase involved in cell wall biosynthesis